MLPGKAPIPREAWKPQAENSRLAGYGIIGKQQQDRGHKDRHKKHYTPTRAVPYFFHLSPRFGPYS